MPTVTYNAGSSTHTNKVNNVRVQVYGGGAPGGGATGNPAGGGGGTGGQYAVSRIKNLVPGSTAAVVAGAAVTGLTTSNLVAGNDSTWAATVIVAKGGLGGAQATVNSTSGAGGVATTAGGVGDTVFAGGNGGTGSLGASGGGGGESGGPVGTGTAGGVTTGGSGNTLSGDGGDAGTTGGTGGVGATGLAPGGGGGGGRAGSATDRASGNGAAGRVIVDWVPPNGLLLLGVG